VRGCRRAPATGPGRQGADLQTPVGAVGGVGLQDGAGGRNQLHGEAVAREARIEGVAAFEEIGPISYEAVVQQIGPALKNSDKVAQVRLGRELAGEFRKRYLEIAAEYGGR
jgi:hypothetical protein